MHECPECGQACDCDGEDVWNEYAGLECVHECEDDSDTDIDGHENLELDELDADGMMATSRMEV